MGRSAPTIGIASYDRAPHGDVARRALRHQHVSARRAGEDLSRSLVVLSGRVRALLFHGARRHRHLADVRIRCERARRVPVGVGAGRPQPSNRLRDPAGPSLGGGVFRSRDPRAHGPDFLQRRVPQTARTQLDDRRVHADAGVVHRLHRLLAAQRRALRHGLANRVQRRALDPAHRPLGSRRFRGRRRLPGPAADDAPLYAARLLPAGDDRRAARPAPVLRRVSEAHAVRARSQARRRPPLLARLRAAHGGRAWRDLGRARADGHVSKSIRSAITARTARGS